MREIARWQELKRAAGRGSIVNYAERTEFEKRIAKSISALDRYLTSVEPYTLIMSYVSTVIPEIVWAFIWHKTSGGTYKLVYELPALRRHQTQQLAESTPWAKSKKSHDEMSFGVVSPWSAKLVRPIQTERESRSARFAALVPYAADAESYEFILEVYFDGDGRVDLAKLETEIVPKTGIILEHLHERRKLLAPLDAGNNSRVERGRIFEAALFDIVSKASRPPLGESAGASHMFIYDARDRLLYHWATNDMTIIADRISSYEPPEQARDSALMEFVRSNIESQDGVSQVWKKKLKDLLQKLSDRDWMRENAKHDSALLLYLLSLLPQEPGTGVAGYAAFTQIPQISSRGNEALWENNTYKDPSIWFPVMLSIEKLFDVATSGNMAAVPMHEAGQLAGVFFVIPEHNTADSRKKSDDTTLDEKEIDPLENTIDLIEMAARAAPVMTLYRTLQFHQAVVTSIYNNRSQPIAGLIAEHAPLAFNTPLVAHWTMKNSGLPALTLWGISQPHERYHQLGTYESADDLFHTRGILETVTKFAQETIPVSVIERPLAGAEHFWGMPSHCIEKFESDLGIKLKAALLVVPPSRGDIVIIYLENSGDVLENNLPLIRRKLGVMQIADEREEGQSA